MAFPVWNAHMILRESDDMSTLTKRKPMERVRRASHSKKEKAPAVTGRRKMALIARNWQLYLFLLPATVYFIIFNYAPMYGVIAAFKKYNAGLGVWGSPWADPWYKNFAQFFDSAWAEITIRNTLILALYSFVVGSILPVLLALMINEVRSNVYKKIVQNATYVPYFVSTVVLVGMVNLFFSGSGAVNQIIMMFGGEKTYFLMKNGLFDDLYVWSGAWQGTGWGSIIYFAALSNASPELHEAAVIDGASRFQRIIHINIPVIMPTFIIMLIMGAGSLISVGAEKVLLMQTDLNLEVSEVINTYVYKVGLVKNNFSLSTAIGLLTNLINMVLLLTVNKISSKVSETSLW